MRMETMWLQWRDTLEESNWQSVWLLERLRPLCSSGSGEQVELEGDALLVVAALQRDPVANMGQFGHVLDDTRQLMGNIPQGKVSFCNREANNVAHRLARYSLTVTNCLMWFEEPPDLILDSLFEDINSIF